MTVTLLLWNIDMTPDLSFTSPFRNAKARYPRIVEILNRYDIVVLNESFLYRKELLNAVAHTYKFTDPKPFFKFFNSGIVILSKYPFCTKAYHHYTHNSYWDLFISKGVLKVSFQISNGVSFDLYGTHMQQYNNDAAQSARLGQVNELVKFVRDETTQNDIIIVGDLNMGPTRDFNHISVHYSDAKDAAARDKQYNTLKDSLQLRDLIEAEDICHLFHRGGLNVKRVDVEVPGDLSDTGAYLLEISDNE